jgi:ribulose-5-phosphate 4-epimerase/fuculose-1-phosphate aldolase
MACHECYVEETISRRLVNMVLANLTHLFGSFITASHILHYNSLFNTCDHLSLRNSNSPSTFFISRNVGLALISAASDIVEYHVFDASPVEPDAPLGFIERYIHGTILKLFLEINSVVHSHSLAVLTFSMTGVPLEPSFSPA